MKGVRGVVRGKSPCACRLREQARLPNIPLIRLTEWWYKVNSALIGLSRLLLSSCHREDIPQRCIYRSSLRPPLLPLCASLHTGFKQRCRSLESCNGISIRIDPQSSLADPLIIEDGALWKSCLLIVGGNLVTDNIQVRCIHYFKRLRDMAVKQTSICRTQRSRGQLSKLIVAKIIGLSRSRALFTYDTPLPQFIQSSHHDIFTLPTCSYQHP